MTGAPPQIIPILERALAGEPPGAAEVEVLLATHEPGAAAELFAAASELRRRRFGDAVFVYGFVYFSTYCRNDCTFCLYRASNPDGPRYRKSLDEVVAVSVGLAESGVHLIDLTMGEDPLYFGSGECEALIALVTAVKAATGLPVMVSPGVVTAEVLTALRDTGAEWYACYQETHARDAYGRLRTGQEFDERAQARLDAAALGLLVEDGMLLGVGETVAERALTVAAMRDEPIDQVRVMTFVPQRGTPLAHLAPAPRLGELVTIATMRLVMPDRLIPASLDVDGIAGLESRIAAGANVVTSIVPPDAGLAGVSQSELDIDEGLRTAPEVTARLAAAGLRVATRREYADWIAAARKRRAAVRS
ncbi:MAG: methylornithine synthase PylB [Thermoleophilia bacterium]